ncbi:hypothetical protein L3Q82_018654 [Scortum barcoo]|uniref:Uncharacterized protein n=1 Tax=Scortum barcoo TaxID=214431 RepID=A0ACB8VEI0_9TELE|nr:hypothetical protein L3Q82_018654 [Scortum barcoo]
MAAWAVPSSRLTTRREGTWNVGLTSTHSWGSGTELLERGWTLHYSGVAQGEWRQAGAGLLIASPAQGRHVLEFTPVNERVASLQPSGRGGRLFVPMGRMAVQSAWPCWSPWEGYLIVLQLETPLFYWGTSMLLRGQRQGPVGNVWLSPLSGRSSTPTSRERFSQILREAGDIESWSGPCSLPPLSMTLAVRSLWTQGLWCLSWRQPPETQWWTPEVRDAVMLKKGFLLGHVGLWDSWHLQLMGTVLTGQASCSPGLSWRQKLSAGGGAVDLNWGYLLDSGRNTSRRISSIPPTRLPLRKRRLSSRMSHQGRPRTRWRDYVSRLAWERLGVPLEKLEEVSGVYSAALNSLMVFGMKGPVEALLPTPWVSESVAEGAA